ncbi:hypothetical protein BASA81_004852 [Batrachochytrium salamandrivorans]|nr:hypothetical protein BASA81_004852 [Batrachochytrium salamandrivorans]
MRFASSSAKPPSAFSNESSGFSEEDEDAPSSPSLFRMKLAPLSIPPTRSMPISIPQVGSSSSSSTTHSTGSSLSGTKRITSAGSLRSMLFMTSSSPTPSPFPPTSPKGEDTLRHFCGSPPTSNNNNNNPLRRLSRSLRSFEDFSHLSPSPTPPQSPTITANEQRLLQLIPHTNQVRDLINTLVMGHDSESSKQVRFLFYVWQFETEPNLVKQKQMANGIVETFLYPQSAFRLGGIPKDLAKCTVDNLGALKLHFLNVLVNNTTVVDFLHTQDVEPSLERDEEDVDIRVHTDF